MAESEEDPVKIFSKYVEGYDRQQRLERYKSLVSILGDLEEIKKKRKKNYLLIAKTGIVPKMIDANDRGDVEEFTHLFAQLLAIKHQGERALKKKLDEQKAKFYYLEELILDYDLIENEKIFKELAILKDFLDDTEIARFDRHYEQIRADIEDVINELTPDLDKKWADLKSILPEDIQKAMDFFDGAKAKNIRTLKLFERTKIALERGVSSEKIISALKKELREILKRSTNKK
ncbi:TPA: hypothetical protein H1005_01070 [archaeon]|uniref:Uncharacterized protein n=1 Tax=Candidatus Naiadarchaeum limnaeum TaxID=2756139 RepID=A0A832XLL4_9ARCH|nr:hypothetical protein [Candidatus Naiadarchaeales archaeon SRR2090153.bin1042]HIK00038.1 hypothetical protein [Candidatus Naiadarchaeum limnaeum]